MRPREVSVTTTIAWMRTWPRGMWADRGISWRIEEEAAIEDRGEEGDGVIEYSLLPPLGGGGSSVLEARERERGIARGCPPALVRRHSFHRPSRLFILLIGFSFFLPFVFSAASPSFSAPTTPAFDSSGPNFNLERRLNTRLCHLPPLLHPPAFLFLFYRLCFTTTRSTVISSSSVDDLSISRPCFGRSHFFSGRVSFGFGSFCIRYPSSGGNLSQE